MKSMPGIVAARTRFEALSLRERLLTLATAAALTWWAVDASLGAYARNLRDSAVHDGQRLSAEIGAQQDALEGLLAAYASSPAQATRRRIDETRRRLDAIQENLEERVHELTGDAPFNEVLGEVLALSSDARIERVETVEPIAVAELDGEPLVWQRGVEITFEADWPTCLAYLEVLEQRASPLIWTDLDYEVGSWPMATIRIGVATLELDPRWST